MQLEGEPADALAAHSAQLDLLVLDRGGAGVLEPSSSERRRATHRHGPLPGPGAPEPRAGGRALAAIGDLASGA